MMRMFFGDIRRPTRMRDEKDEDSTDIYFGDMLQTTIKDAL